MRTLLLASVLVVLAACSDNQQPTAPRSPSSRGSAAGDVAPVGQGIKLPDAKPAGQTGFTSVTTVTTPVNHQIDGIAITAWTVDAVCPAGSTLVSGGYAIDLGWPNARVAYSGPSGANGWRITMQDANAGAIWFHVFAVCAQ